MLKGGSVMGEGLHRPADARPVDDRQREWALLHLLATLVDIASDVETQRGAADECSDGPTIGYDDTLACNEMPGKQGGHRMDGMHNEH